MISCIEFEAKQEMIFIPIYALAWAGGLTYIRCRQMTPGHGRGPASQFPRM